MVKALTIDTEVIMGAQRLYAIGIDLGNIMVKALTKIIQWLGNLFPIDIAQLMLI
jgi:hypothetical protein